MLLSCCDKVWGFQKLQMQVNILHVYACVGGNLDKQYMLVMPPIFHNVQRYTYIFVM